MILKELENLVRAGREKGLAGAYITNSLKEYLQIYILFFVYTSPAYMKNLIFTGGTCLRHFFGLERLSVDLDFDLIDSIDPEKMNNDVKTFFGKRYKYDEMESSIKQDGGQILFKFPVLKKLGLAQGSESDLLYVKVDLSKLPSQNYVAEITSKTKYGFNFVARHYDLPSLVAGKLHAVLTREYLRGKDDRKSIKGRDYFDLLWFVKNGVKPNLERLSDMLGYKIDPVGLETKIDEKVEVFLKKHKGDFESDIVPLIENPEIIKTFVDNYRDEYLRYKALSFSSNLKLDVRCARCGKIFSSGIVMPKESFESVNLSENTHKCPFCGHMNKVGKKGYVVL